MAIKKGTNLGNTLLGTTLADQIFGLGGNDILFGFAGKDLLDGGTGADRMTGGTGNDTYVVNTAGDRTIEAANQGIDTVRSSISHTLAANVENLVLTGGAAINGTLSSLATSVGNTLTGNAAANILNGGLGSDVLNGGLGADTLNGGDGNDTLRPGGGFGVADVINGGAGFDTVDYSDALGGVTVLLSDGYVGGGYSAGHRHAEGDIIRFDVESVVGSRFADVLQAGAHFANAFGGAGNDRILGNESASYDRLRGDDGIDTLIGAGFVGFLDGAREDFLLQYNRGWDVVLNYRQVGDDHVVLENTEFNLSLSGGARFITTAEFGSGDSVSGEPDFSATQRLFYDTTSHILWADKDGSGAAFQPVAIALFGTNSAAPTAGDIWLI